MQHRTLSLFAATSLVVAGLASCKAPVQDPGPQAYQTSPAPTGTPFGINPLATDRRDNAQATAEAMGDERDFDDFDTMIVVAGAAAYAVNQAPARDTLTGAVKDALVERQNQVKTRVADRLAAKSAITDKLKEALAKAVGTTDANGNRTRTFTFVSARGTTALGRTQAMDVTATVTTSPDGVVIYSKYEGTQAGTGTGGDRSRSFSRVKEVAADGTTTITFRRERTFRDGRVWTALWTRTIGLDGKVTGTGTITRKAADGTTKSIKLNFGGTYDSLKATTTDGDGTETAVTLPMVGDATAAVGDTSVPVEEDVPATTDAAAEPSASPSASASPAAS